MHLLERRWFLVAGIVLSAILHAPFVNRPPESVHLWRQANTLALARNFHTESMNLFKPRVDNRYHTDGVTGTPFPAYEYGLATLYHLTREQYWVQRVYAFGWHIVGIFGIAALVMTLFGSRRMSMIAGWMWLWSPELFYYASTTLPDPLALAASIWGLHWLLTWMQQHRDGTPSRLVSILAMSALVLAGLTKLQYLAVGFAAAGFWLGSGKSLRKGSFLRPAVGLAIVSVLVPLCWYKYANNLIEDSGLTDFVISIKEFPESEVALSILWHNLISDLPEMLLNYATSICFVIGAFFAIKSARRRPDLALMGLIWAAGLVLYHVIEVQQMKAHSYYMMPHLPLLIIMAAYGAEQIIKRFKPWILCVLLVAMPVLCAVRIIPARWVNPGREVPPELYDPIRRARIVDALPADKNLPILMGYDQTGCLMFYYLDRHGYGLNWPGQLGFAPHGEPQLHTFIKQGVEYAVLRDIEPETEAVLGPMIDSTLVTEGDFRVVRFKQLNRN